ncbi:alkylated DNA repair protein alkB homolog 8 [Uranotaenia lowii]|uniref:alkylated DNA repair protein alkB homolog 8 n=1 Tax=Uranotaenia lowii TaxID=190385 RepID=UPI00247A43F2|nr:alkylated DNA repair protein alkB homolog 8 [Uranotaenia lowii]
MLSKNTEKKLQRKIRRCQQLIGAETGITFSDSPTKNIAVCNAGLSTGLRQEVLLEEVLAHNPGQLEDVYLPVGKSYCFLLFDSCESSQRVSQAMNGISRLGQDECVLLMAFVEEVPSYNTEVTEELPAGLIVSRDFIDESFEKMLMQSVNWDEEDCGTLKHRRVRHFGYEFLYGTNNIDRSKPLQQNIPKELDSLWEKLKQQHPNLSWHVPDQLTVNRYEVGQGIPPHVDTHSAFQDPIVSLSLGSDIVMDFRNTKGCHVSVDVPRRSLLIMSGESRYGWTHGITPRKMDTIKMGKSLSVRRRDVRVSFTFRKLNDGPCRCNFHALCDTFLEEKSSCRDHLLENAAQVELENVHKVYNEIAKHFSETRHSPWPKVEDFLSSLNAGSLLLDIGCGNGKYLGLNKSLINVGCDRSDGLLKVCAERGFQVVQSNCLALPFRSSSADACISIAVIHHLATEERRKKSVSEMVRVLKPAGRALIYVWAKNQEANLKKSSYLRQNKQNRKSKNEEVPVVQQGSPNDNQATVLPVHTNRTQFQHQDLLVPWKLRNVESQKADPPKVTFLRYYHVFEENELEQLCNTIGGITIEKSYYDQGNWCVIFKKN